MNQAVLAALFITLSVAVNLSPGSQVQAQSSEQLIAETGDFEEISIRPLSHKEVKRRFATGLKKDHLVLEVILKPAQETEVERHQFGVRRQGSDFRIRPIEPEVLAAQIQGKKPPRKVAVAPVATIGYESGSRRDDRYDPYGNRRPRGLYTNVGVGVGVGTGPGVSPEDESVMAQELADRELPLGTIDGKVQGYLYFPLKVGRNQPLSLVFEHQGETVVLSFRRP